MKNLYIAILLIVFCLPLTANAQLGIGIRDSRYVNISYTFKHHYTAKLEHSVYAEKFACQYLRGYVEYKNSIKALSFSVSPFYGRTYNSNYWNAGALVNASFQVNRFDVYGTLNPLYDSTFGYKTCFSVGALVNILSPISIVAEYTTIPQYRMSEKRVRAGLNFKFNRFTCTPLISIPLSGNAKAKSLRIDFSLSYLFW